MVMLFLFTILISICQIWALMNNTDAWTGKSYPDLRGPTKKRCGAHIPQRSYLCDPDGIISTNEAASLNIQLHDLTNATKCKCQRIGQCVGEDLEGNSVEIGFIVAVAFARRLAMSVYKPNKTQILHAAEQFCVSLRGRWALGDCGNTAIILIWEEHNLLFILTDRETKLYVTHAEIDKITKRVQDFVEHKQYRQALDIVLKEIKKEIQGDKEKRTDIGYWSLIISVVVAIVFVIIITGCVCAFRFCGNLRSDGDLSFGQRFESVDTLKSEVKKRGTLLRRSLTRSPKIPHHQASSSDVHRLDHVTPLIPSSPVHRQSGVPSPSTRQLLSPMAIQQIPPRTNMARLATQYYSLEDGHSMV